MKKDAGLCALREETAQAGIEHFELMPALNESPKFIRALAELVLARSRLS